LKLSYDKSSIHWVKYSQSREVARDSEKTGVKVFRLSKDTGTYELLAFMREF
jgi:hypothetical protein